MAHVVFAAPDPADYHLHERLARALEERGMRVTVLTADPREAAFWAAQPVPAYCLKPGPADASTATAPIAAFAHAESRLQSPIDGAHGPARRRATDRPASAARISRRLSQHLNPTLRFFTTDPAEVVVLHRRRDGLARMLAWAARESGSTCLWTGPGAIPHTLQIDRVGLDGESGSCTFDEVSVRRTVDDALLDAALAQAFARTRPLPLSRRPVERPGVRAWTAARWQARIGGWPGGSQDGEPGSAAPPWVSATEAPARPYDQLRAPAVNLPSTPFVAVVLQREDDPRVRLDAAFVPTAIDLVRATARAAHRIEPGMPLVAVLPDGGIRRADLDTLRAMDGIQITPGITAPEVTAAAVAVVTLNDSRAVTGLLAGTPVVHCGRAFWARPGVAIASCVDRLEVDLPRAVQTRSEPDGGRSRREFLTWLLQEGHVWCSPSMPDQNGIGGLVGAIEGEIQHPWPGRRMGYRSGPAWPLSAR